jgi:hypothetical protein
MNSQAEKTNAEALVDAMLLYAANQNCGVKETTQLFHEAVAAINKLARYAAQNRNSLADFVLAMLAQICAENALQIIINDPGSGAEDHLVASLTGSVQKLTEAVNSSPKPFIKSARGRAQWPVLWALRDNGETHNALARKLQLRSRA